MALGNFFRQLFVGKVELKDEPISKTEIENFRDACLLLLDIPLSLKKLSELEDPDGLVLTEVHQQWELMNLAFQSCVPGVRSRNMALRSSVHRVIEDMCEAQAQHPLAQELRRKIAMQRAQL